MKLFDINTRIREILEGSLDTETGELVDITDEQMLELSQLDMAFTDVANSVALYIQELIGQAEIIKAKGKVLTDRAKAMSNKADRLKQYLIENLEVRGMKKFETDDVRLSISTRPNTQVLDPELLQKWANMHTEYTVGKIVTEFKPDLNAIKKLITDGTAVDGCIVVEKDSIKIS